MKKTEKKQVDMAVNQKYIIKNRKKTSGEKTMYPVPITYLYQFEGLNENQRRAVMREFAVNGAKHLALTDTLLGDILKKESLMDQMQQEMANEGLTFADAHAMFGVEMDLNCLNPQKRRMMIARHKLQLEIIAYMGVDTITIHIGNNREQPCPPIDVHFNLIRESLAELLPVAEELGVIINIENIWHPNNTPEMLLKFKETFPTDALGFCYDAGHANIMAKGKNYEDGLGNLVWKTKLNMEPQWDEKILEKMLPHVVTCHIHDNKGDTDSHWLPGSGNIDWQHITGLLKQAPRLKYIQSEVIPFTANASIKDLCAKFNKLFSETTGL